MYQISKESSEIVAYLWLTSNKKIDFGCHKTEEYVSVILLSSNVIKRRFLLIHGWYITTGICFKSGVAMFAPIEKAVIKQLEGVGMNLSSKLK